jgi:hypothetical protein
MDSPLVDTTCTWGTPRSEQLVLPVLWKSTAPATEDELPPNWLKSTEAAIDDAGHAAVATVVVVVCPFLVAVGDGDEQPATSTAVVRTRRGTRIALALVTGR